VLHRYNTVLDELFHGQEVRIVTADWSDVVRVRSTARWKFTG
jgi:hypothetical protein